MNASGDTLENHLRQLEEALLQPDVRKSARVSELLADEFVEFGSSGRTFDKNQIIATLTEEIPTQVTLSEFRMQLLSENIALVTYRTHRHTEPPVYALRSSIWKFADDQWRVIFHQGTITTK